AALFALTPVPFELTTLSPVPVEVFVTDSVADGLALVTPRPNAPPAAFVFVTCSCADGDAPVSDVFASTEFGTPRLNTPPTPLPATARVEIPPTSTQTAPTAQPFTNDPPIPASFRTPGVDPEMDRWNVHFVTHGRKSCPVPLAGDGDGDRYGTAGE